MQQGESDCTKGYGYYVADGQLGRGKAFYDTFLAKYTAERSRPLLGKWWMGNSSLTMLVALALAPQMVDEPVPVTPSDFTLDAVVSPAGIVWRDGVRRD
jgi:5-formyltetrahydrofolate cyclo-ligase